MIRGHGREKEIFSRILKDDRLHHAYILSGREGTGKKLFALEVARALVCEEGKFLEKCSCRHCRLIDFNIERIKSEKAQKKTDTKKKNEETVEASPHPDIRVIEQTPLKIETARDINNNAFLSPMTAKKKVYIIDNADFFGQEAANALLKTLEEPPADTCFFLITSRYQQVLHTIRSRCININFGQLSYEDVFQIVGSVSARPEEEITAAVKICSGSPGQALKILENTDRHSVFKGITSRTELYEEINALETKEQINTYCASLYIYLIERYRVSGRETLLDFSNYLLDILKRLEYNVSLDIFRLDLYIKTIEVLSEKS